MNSPFDLEIGSWDTPKPGPNDVLIRTKAVGICVGDLYFYQGKNPYAKYPQICGHEIAGVVVEAGSNVDSIKPGTRVVVEPFIGCGTCYPCRAGKSNCCAKLEIIGVHRAGGFAEQLIAPHTHVHVIPDELSFSMASFAEPVAIGVQACRRGDVMQNEHVLVLGCGPIGLAIIEVARSRGARILATDISPTRLDMAAKLGAETFISDDRLVQNVLDRTSGEGMPVVLEATGNSKVMEQTVELVAAGGRIVIVGLVKKGVMIPFPGLDFTRKEMTIVGSRASVNCFPEALSLLKTGAITYTKVASEFEMWKAPDIFKKVSQEPESLHKGVLILN